MYRHSKILKLTTAALLLAISVILTFFEIPLTQFLEIRFTMLPLAAAGMLLGPIYGCLIGALSDIIGFIVRPTGPYFPGFTLTTALIGLICGLLLYKKHDIVRIIIACVIVGMAINLLLQTEWLSLLYGTPFIVLLAARVVKELIMLPIHIVLVTLILKLFDKSGISIHLNAHCIVSQNKTN